MQHPSDPEIDPASESSASNGQSHVGKETQTERNPEPLVPSGPETARKRKDKSRLRNGKVARLPKAARDSICRMIRDGMSYPAILKTLGDTAVAAGLSTHCLSEWRTNGGYAEWLDEQAWAQQLQAEKEFALELLQEKDETNLNRVVLQIAVTQVFQALRSFAPANLRGQFDSDPANYTRLLNSICRLSRETVFARKYNDTCQRLQLASHQGQQPLLDPKRKLTDSERLAIVRHVDEILGLAAPEPQS